MAGFNNLADIYRAQDRVRIFAIADVKRHALLPDVPTFQELGFDVDDTSVNFRGYAFPKGVGQGIIDKVAAIVPVMFNDPEAVAKMKASGSPMLILDREEVLKMFKEKEVSLRKILADRK